MVHKLVILCICVILAGMPGGSVAGDENPYSSAYWSNLVKEENSLVASVLLLPYLALQVPVRLIDGILFPKPASQSTVPPPAHRAPH
jgi:hypothetical protein